MNVNRKVIKRLNISEDIDDGYVKASKSECVSMIWEITKDAWSFIRSQDAEQRLQRNVANFTGRKG
jgi:hypothetical protein